MTLSPPFADQAVRAAFDAFSEPAQAGLLALRRLIYSVAADTEGVGGLQETLKWGQPAYLTPETGSGSTLRLGAPKQGGFAIYAHCQTTIISGFRSQFPDEFTYDGARAITFQDGEIPPPAPMSMLIRTALTYHLARRSGRRAPG